MITKRLLQLDSLFQLKIFYVLILFSFYIFHADHVHTRNASTYYTQNTHIQVCRHQS